MIQKMTLIGMTLLLIVACDTTTNEPEIEGDFKVTIENIAEAKSYSASGAFNTPVGAAAPAPIFPGEAYEATFSAAPGSKLSFATMFVQSNDLFYAPDGGGIDLYDSMGDQAVGDITNQVMLWDAGSEMNQEPGLGSDQAPRQAGANTGTADSDNTVRLATDDFSNLPAVSDVVMVTLSSTGDTGFTLRIENVSSSATLMTSDGASHAVPLAPGVFVIHSGENVLFTAGMMDYGYGLATIAEDGDPSGLATMLATDTGVTQLYAPGVYVVHESANPLFTAEVADQGEGLEDLAEDGDPSSLAAALSSSDMYSTSGAFNTPTGAAGPGALAPGASYEFVFTAVVGDYLSLATMLVQSNDLFVAPSGMGIALFNDGAAMTGDVTSYLSIWDAGTEVNETPGVGLNQAPRQAGAGAGMDEMGLVRMVDDMYDYPALSEIIRVTITEI
ncbi:MAG: spondin domain-containing protein [Candidatus Marinimicrobia bacterium]|nr:spondin domain-containing protein [FCB group bacterium]MBL7027953.1 spondin domain-containing protein [Candidatus Neomarinimicrobiota bacterium]